jgi:predicted anti-sigma-YlaC factor YlaD
MNSPIEPCGKGPRAGLPRPECPDEAVIEEYAAQRAARNASVAEPRSAQEDAPPLEDHLASCEVCRTRTEELARETRVLTEWLALPVIGVEEEACLALEDLGCYLDGSLTPAGRAAVESHLAHCAQCRCSLAELYREVRTILADEMAGAPLLSIDEQPVQFAERRDAAKPDTSSHAAFSMEEWLKRPEAQTSADAAQPSDRKQRKPRQSTQ